jgi:hypothetical protein
VRACLHALAYAPDGVVVVHEGVDKCVEDDSAEHPGLVRSRPEPSVRDQKTVVPSVEEGDVLLLHDEDHRIQQLRSTAMPASGSQRQSDEGRELRRRRRVAAAACG